MRPTSTRWNPYPELLVEALAAQGLEVESFGESFSGLPIGPGVLIYHWPNQFFFRTGERSLRQVLLFLAGLWRGKILWRQRLVWVAHNVLPHRREGRPFRLGRRLFLATVDGLIFLSPSSRRLFVEAYPQLAGRPYTIVSHGHYKARATRPARPPPPIGERPVRLAFVGQVRRYKAPDLLAKLVSDLPNDAELVIAGACDEEDLRDELARHAARGANLQLRLEYLGEAEIEAVVDRADAVVLPYRDIVNSGSALLALSRARPVIAPRLGGLVDLQQQVGAGWIWLYDGELTAPALQAALAWIRGSRGSPAPDLSEHDWPRIGAETAAFVRRISS